MILTSAVCFLDFFEQGKTIAIGKIMELHPPL
jgi:hypothetical protein